jgi:hypothetical protein
MARVALGLRHLKNEDKIMFAYTVLTSMEQHPDIFPDPPVPFQMFRQQVTATQEAQQKCLSRSMAATTIRNKHMEIMLKSLKLLASYVKVVSHEKELIIQKAGMHIWKSPYPRFTEISAPRIKDLRDTTLFGEVKVRYTRIQNAAIYQVQYCLGDALNDNWQDGKKAPALSCIVKNLPSGQVAWFRVRAIGSVGDSDWSSPVCKRVS